MTMMTNRFEREETKR